MNTVCTKVALVPLALAATWITAQADATLTTTFTPPASVGVVDHVRIFAEDYTPSDFHFETSTFDPPGVYISGSAALSQDLGSVAASSTIVGSKTVAYAAGTSAYAGLLGTVGTDQLFLTSNGLNDAAANQYLGAGTNFADVYGAIVSGSTAPLISLYGNQENSGNTSHGLSLTNFAPGTVSSRTLSAYVFTRSAGGTVTSSAQVSNLATLSVTPVPEPAPLAALALGGLALARRRRRLA